LYNQEAINHLVKLLKDHQAELSKSADSLLSEVAGEDLNQKRTSANALLAILRQVRKLAPASRIPSWLTELEKGLDEFLKAGINSSQLVRILFGVIPSIKEHDWVLDDTKPRGFDFEEIFKECKENSRIPELFDLIVELLEQIRDSGELDSKSMSDALSKVIATLQVGKKASYFAMEGAWQFLCGFLENYFWAEAKKLPVLGSVFEALETTMKETQEELIRLNIQVHDSITMCVKEEVKVLQGVTSPVFTVYGRSGRLIPSSNVGSSGESIKV